MVLLDGDTLVTGDVASYFDYCYDVGFTVKDEQVPINSGVILVKEPKKSLIFFRNWRELTIAILKDQSRFDEAISLYGGVDQMAFAEIIRYKRESVVFNVLYDQHDLSFKAFPCSVLNETRSVPVVSETLIYHFKGGWRRILTEGNLFTKKRPRKKSFGMYLLYMKNYIKAFDVIINKVESDKRIDMGLVVPFYVHYPGIFAVWGYGFYVLAFRIKKIYSKIGKKIYLWGRGAG